MSQIPHAFSKRGMQRAVAAIRAHEQNDPLAGAVRGGRGRGGGVGPEAFVVGRVTEVDADDATLLSVKEQFWDDEEGDMIDLPAGRTWDGEDGNLAKVKAVDGHSRIVDDLVVLGFKMGADGTSVWYVLPGQASFFWAKVTASSSSTADITLAEVDSAGDVLADGRTPADARVPNERKGVPVDTFGVAFELPPVTADGEIVTKFVPWDGITVDPKNLIANGATADTQTYDIEEDGSPVESNSGRIHLAGGMYAAFWRDKTKDASGMQTKESEERVAFLLADGVSGTEYDGSISIVPDAGLADTAYIRHDTPLATASTITLTLSSGDDSITFGDGSVSSRTLNFDQGGHNNDGTVEKTFDIRVADGGAGADGQGYEDVHLNGASVEATTDGGIIDFRDDQTASAGAAKVDYTVTGDAAGTATVKGEVDIDAYLKSIAGYDAGKTQVLTNTSGTIGWTDTAECP